MDLEIRKNLLATIDTVGWSLVGVNDEVKDKFISLCENMLPLDIILDIIKIADKSSRTLAELNDILPLDTSVLYNYMLKSNSLKIIKHDFVKVAESVSGKRVIILFKTKKQISLYLENNLLGVLASKLMIDPENTEYEYCGCTSDSDETIILIFE